MDLSEGLRKKKLFVQTKRMFASSRISTQNPAFVKPRYVACFHHELIGVSPSYKLYDPQYGFQLLLSREPNGLRFGACSRSWSLSTGLKTLGPTSGTRSKSEAIRGSGQQQLKPELRVAKLTSRAPSYELVVASKRLG
jgi:hypothetical protein